MKWWNVRYWLLRKEKPSVLWWAQRTGWGSRVWEAENLPIFVWAENAEPGCKTGPSLDANTEFYQRWRFSVCAEQSLMHCGWGGMSWGVPTPHCFQCAAEAPSYWFMSLCLREKRNQSTNHCLNNSQYGVAYHELFVIFFFFFSPGVVLLAVFLMLM